MATTSAFGTVWKTLILSCSLSCVCSDVQPPGSSNIDGLHLREVVVVVLSQTHPYHVRRADLFRQHFMQQVDKFSEDERPVLVFTHEKWPEVLGAWTVFPLIADLAKEYSDKKWLIVCEEETRIDLPQLLIFLQQYNENEDPFLGRALRDQQSTIIHHFYLFNDPQSFAYPDIGAGVALSLSLVKRLADKLAEGVKQSIQFSIDPKHEFAKYLLDQLEVRMTPVCELCGNDKQKQCQCATWQPHTFPTDCGGPVAHEDLFVAVKTCSQFHEDRVPVVKATWGKETELIEYYSEEEDLSIPTVNLGVPNTERGHCGKTQAILRHFANSEKFASIPWLLIADDDTIINLERLRQLLACYRTEDPVFLGERYGYAVVQGYGYNYITGGGGMVFNRAAANLLSKELSCPSDDAPDDMMLGMFFASRGLPLMHSPYFHQARPEDYCEDWLSGQMPVSFHKHWNTDPYTIYQRLTTVPTPPPAATDRHEEL